MYSIPKQPGSTVETGSYHPCTAGHKKSMQRVGLQHRMLDLCSTSYSGTYLRTCVCACIILSSKLLLQVFLDSSMPVINHYETKGKVRRFDATPPSEEVFKGVRELFVQMPAPKV